MKQVILILALLAFDGNQMHSKTNSHAAGTSSISTEDKAQIQKLIRDVLTRADSKNAIDLLPVSIDQKGRIYKGFDLVRHKQNLITLSQTNFFSTGFIENYNQLILTLDQGLKSGYYARWEVGSLPPFQFGNDQSPWCQCQDNLDWNQVDIRVIELSDKTGDLTWTWGNLKSNIDSSWREFSYPFKVTKENSQWKIDYLEGFDLKKGIQKSEHQ